jgi:hypothetical protein
VGKQLHVYTAGANPYVVVLDDVTLFVHQGLPQAAGPPTSGDTGDPPPTIHLPGTLPPLYENFIQAPEHSSDWSEFLRGQDQDSKIEMGIELGFDASQTGVRGDQLAAAIIGLAESDADDIAIHAVLADHGYRE